jgi:uncharacterized GH25 family protein
MTEAEIRQKYDEVIEVGDGVFWGFNNNPKTGARYTDSKGVTDLIVNGVVEDREIGNSIPRPGQGPQPMLV